MDPNMTEYFSLIVALLTENLSSIDTKFGQSIIT